MFPCRRRRREVVACGTCDRLGSSFAREISRYKCTFARAVSAVPASFSRALLRARRHSVGVIAPGIARSARNRLLQSDIISPDSSFPGQRCPPKDRPVQNYSSSRGPRDRGVFVAFIGAGMRTSETTRSESLLVSWGIWNTDNLGVESSCTHHRRIFAAEAKGLS